MGYRIEACKHQASVIHSLSSRRWKLAYHRDIKQSVKKYDRYAAAEHYNHQPGPSCFNTHRTHRIARNTSVTLNLFSTLQACSHAPSPSPSLSSNSPKKVNAHRSPHHTAGAVLRARHISRGMYHLALTPNRTATRGCRAFEIAAWCFTGREEEMAS